MENHHLDDRALRTLIEESEDVHADAMRTAGEPLDELIDRSRDLRSSDNERSGWSTGQKVGAAALAAGGFAAASGARSAYAADDTVVMALQTAASLENLAVLTYTTALTLPYIKDGNKVVKAFAETTMRQHSEHGKAFNAKARDLGGQEQTGTNPKYTPVVQQMIPALKKGGPLDVVKLAITLEDVATSTYVQNIQTLSDPQVRLLFGTVAGVESQHLATLLAVQALLTNNLASEVALPPPHLNKLPMQTAALTIPEDFKKTTLASPASEGAVK